MEEVLNDFLEDLGLESDFRNKAINQIIAGESRYIKDLRINLKNVLKSKYLSPLEANLTALSVAINQKNETLIDVFAKKCIALEATESQLAEIWGITSLLCSNNVLYRFRHFTKKEKYGQLPARIKMNIMMKPVLGKELFELISLVVSSVNGCEQCVNSHEHSLLELGSTEERIFDAIRIASVIASLDRIVY